MELEQCRRRFAEAQTASLATVGEKGPHLVPVVFAVDGDRIFTAVDHKPKRSVRLQRLKNISTDPAVSLLVDHYEETWERLWWVRADGIAEVIHDSEQMKHGIGLLVAKYPQYANHRPQGPLIKVAVEQWSGWAANGGAA